MGGYNITNTAHSDLSKVWCGTKQQVGATVLIFLLIVTTVAGAAWQKEPALECLTPGSRLVYQITWEGPNKSDYQWVRVSKTNKIQP